MLAFIIIIIMYIYFALINALSAHKVHINLNTIITMYIYLALINVLSAHKVRINLNTIVYIRNIC